MNSITNSSIKTTSLALAVFVFIALSLGVTSNAKAADLGIWGYDYSYPVGGGIDTWGYDYSYPVSGGQDAIWGYDYSYPVGGGDTWGYDYSYPVYGDYSYGGGSYYSSPSYFPSFFSSIPSSGGSYQTQSQSQAQSSVNTNVNNNIITIGGTTQTPAPQPPTPTYNYPVCSIVLSTTYVNRVGQPVTLSWTSSYATSGFITGVGNVSVNGSTTVYPNTTTTYTGTFYGYNGQTVTCSATVTFAPTYAPVYPVYPQTPYVTLSAAPYTGLELGTVGTALYWTFLVIWCLIAAYLIVVKRVQNAVFQKLNAFLFGAHGSTAHTAQKAHVAHTAHTTRAEVKKEEDTIDPFIASQIFRGR